MSPSQLQDVQHSLSEDSDTTSASSGTGNCAQHLAIPSQSNSFADVAQGLVHVFGAGLQTLLEFIEQLSLAPNDKLIHLIHRQLSRRISPDSPEDVVAALNG